MKALEEQVAAVYEDVSLGDLDPQEPPTENKKRGKKSGSLRGKLQRNDGS